MTYIGHTAHLKTKPVDKQCHSEEFGAFVREYGATVWSSDTMTFGPPPMRLENAYEAALKYDWPCMSEHLNPDAFHFGEEHLRRSFKPVFCNRACTGPELENYLKSADHKVSNNLRNPARYSGPGAVFDKVSIDKTPWLEPGKVYDLIWTYRYTIPVSSCRLKYEMRPLEKGPRHYNPAQVNHYIMGVNLFSHHHDVFLKMFTDRYAKTAVGINPFQGGWDELYRRLKRKGSRYISTDISKQDAHMMSKFIYMIRDLFLEYGEYSDIERIWVTKWFEDIVETIIVLPDGHCYIKHLGNPSGNYLTCMINTFHTIFLMAYSMFRNGMVTTIEEFEEILAACFGDDNVMEFHKDWDFDAYASTIKNELGHDLTLEAPLGHLRDQTFLSKAFYKPPGRNVWVFIPTNYEKNFASLWYNNGNNMEKYIQMVASYRLLYYWSQPHFQWLTHLYRFLRRYCDNLRLQKCWVDNFKSDAEIESLHLGVLEGDTLSSYTELISLASADYDVLQGGGEEAPTRRFITGSLRPVINKSRLEIVLQMAPDNESKKRKRSKKNSKGKGKAAPPKAAPQPQKKKSGKKKKGSSSGLGSYLEPPKAPVAKYPGMAFIRNQSFQSYVTNSPIPVNLGGSTYNCVFFDRLMEFTTPADGKMSFTVKPNLRESLVVKNGEAASGTDVKGSYLFNGGANSHNSFNYKHRGHYGAENNSGYHLTFPKGSNNCWMDGIAEFDVNAKGSQLVRAVLDPVTEEYHFPISGTSPAGGSGSNISIIMNRQLLPADAGHGAESVKFGVQYLPAGGAWTDLHCKTLVTADGQNFQLAVANGLVAGAAWVDLRFGFVTTNLRQELSILSCAWSVNTLTNTMTANDGTIQVHPQNGELYNELLLQNNSAVCAGTLAWWGYEGDLEKSGEWIGTAQPQGAYSREVPSKDEMLQKAPWKRIRVGKGLIGVGYMNNMVQGFTPHPLTATNPGVDDIHVCVETNGAQKISLLMVHCVYYEPTTRFTATVKVPQEVGAECNLLNFINGSEKIFENENHIPAMIASGKRALEWAGAGVATIEKYSAAGASMLMKVSKGAAFVAPLLMAML